MINFDTDVPSSASRECAESAPEDEFGAHDYRKILELKTDHKSRPLWVVSFIASYYSVVYCVFLWKLPIQFHFTDFTLMLNEHRELM